jgi:hypothetical protein
MRTRGGCRRSRSVMHGSCDTPSLRANGSRERAPDDRLREATHGPSFRGDAKHRARNLEIPRCAIAHLRSGPSDHPGMTKGGLLRRFAPRNDVKSRYASAIPRRDPPEFCKDRSRLDKQRAQGKPGAQCTRRWSNGPLPSKQAALATALLGGRVARLCLEGRRSSLTLMV